MTYLLDFLQDHKTIVTTVSIISFVFFAASIIVLPIIITQLPANYFLNEKRLTAGEKAKPSATETLLAGFKNIIGTLLILAGIAMLILPGQGLLTILIGFSLTNFPGKYTLERKLIARPSIFKTLNWIRHKAGRKSLRRPS